MAHSTAVTEQRMPRPANVQSRGEIPRSEPPSRASGGSSSILQMALHAERGFPKASADQLFRRIAAASSLPAGKVRAQLIPDSSWKRARKKLGPQASQTAARVRHILTIAERVWGNEKDALEWLNSPHMELQGATPLSLLKTEAGGRAIGYLLGALEYGFPV